MLFQQKMIQAIVKLCVSPQVQAKLIPAEALVHIVTHFLSWLTLMQNTLMVCSVLLEIIYKILKICKAMIKLYRLWKEEIGSKINYCPVHLPIQNQNCPIFFKTKIILPWKKSPYLQWCAIENHQDPFYVVKWHFSRRPKGSFNNHVEKKREGGG